MTPVLKKYKAAAVNAEPGWFNLEESVRRTIHWIDEAGKAGCKMIAFPELCTSPILNETLNYTYRQLRDPRLPLLGLESHLPRKPPPPQILPREQPPLGLPRDAAYPPRSPRQQDLRLPGLFRTRPIQSLHDASTHLARRRGD